LEQFSQAIQRFGIGRLAMILGVGAGVAAALVALTLTLGKAPQALLYSNLDLKEASSVTQALDQAGVKYSVKGDGSTIMVSRDEVASARLLVSGKGLVTQGSVGYEIFDNTNALGQTDFVQKLNQQRALEGELGRTIREWDGVQSVRVHLALPKRQLFEEEAEQASATVALGVGGREPSADMVRAVQNLVSGAVLGMKVDRVTVVDQHGKTLSANSDGSIAGKLAEDRKTEVEARIAKTVKELVEGVVGPGRAQVKVTAALDLNRITVQEERYDPDGQVVRSESTSAENAAENKADGANGVTAAANIPGGAAGGFQALGSTSGANESVTNYEISKSVRTEVTEPGTVKKLSVAVAVDGATAVGADGKPGAYTPRTAQEMQQIKDLVSAAVGFDQARGDTVTVINVKFPREAADNEGVTSANPLMGFDKNDIMRVAELGIAAIVAILIMLFLVRPLLRNANGAGQQMMLAGAGPGGASQLVTLTSGATSGAAADALAALPGPEMDNRINIAKIEGQVKASSIKQVSDFATKHPEESVSILRSWLHESA